MQRSDRWPDDYDPATPRSRPGSRRNSGSSRRNSLKKEEIEKKNSPVHSTPNSTNSTPKKVQKPPNLDFVVTGKQIPKRYDRANSLPGSSYHRRPSSDALNKTKRSDASRRSPPAAPASTSHSSRSHDASVEDDTSLDLSQVSDFEDTNSKYGVKPRPPMATSTPKSVKIRSGSLQAHVSRMEASRNAQKSRDSTFSREDSLYKNSSVASQYNKYSTTSLEYSSVSPEYSRESSSEMSPGGSRRTDPLSPTAEQHMSSSCCTSSWMDCSEVEDTKVEQRRSDGEWNNFWANYNNSVSKVPMKGYYDQCPTPYRTENIDLVDLDFSNEGSRKRSPENIQNINQIIRNEGLHLTPRETQNIIKCAHILGNVLTKAIERRVKEKEDFKIEEVPKEEPVPELDIKKKTLTLNLKETNLPLDTQEGKRSETVTTQTDISLPNTKSAPKIFENILRQLSRSSIDEGILNKAINKEVKAENVETINENEQTCEKAE